MVSPRLLYDLHFSIIAFTIHSRYSDWDCSLLCNVAVFGFGLDGIEYRNMHSYLEKQVVSFSKCIFLAY